MRDFLFLIALSFVIFMAFLSYKIRVIACDRVGMEYSILADSCVIKGDK